MDKQLFPINAKVCAISARRYGDAIINARFLKAAALARPDVEWVIWTKPEFVALFKLMGFNKIVTSNFPIAGGAPQFFKDFGRSVIKAIFQLRLLKLDASIDFIGDSREAFLGAAITGGQHYSPAWAASHWMHKLIWTAKIPLVRYIKVDSSQDRMYENIASLLNKLTDKKIGLDTQLQPLNTTPRLAFHPFSSQSFKAWPNENWQLLAEQLILKGMHPIVLCTPLEREIAAAIFYKFNDKVQIYATKSIEDLVGKLQSIDILVGVDSFLIHLASALEKQTIVLNSGNLPKWWQPPNSIALGQSGGCKHYPCSNEPSCLGLGHESQCIRSLAPIQAIEALNKLTSRIENQ